MNAPQRTEIFRRLAAANPAPAGKPLSPNQLRRAQLAQLPGKRKALRF